jgi:hypothetical protein
LIITRWRGLSGLGTTAVSCGGAGRCADR